jgi:uncharacterized protein (DUF58 family)
MPDGLLRALELEVTRRIDGLLAGDFRASLLGPGTELAQVRPYAPGDDVRDIEWNVTARTGEPHVRVKVAERVLTTWVMLDVSPSMTFGTTDRRKADVAEGVALALGHLATRRGNRLGFMTFGEPAPSTVRPSQGRAGMLRLLGQLRREPAAEGSAGLPVAEALKRAHGIFRSRAAVFLVTDLIGPIDWRRALMRLVSRHEVVIVEIGDPRERELPDVGDLWLVDPETGRQLRVDTGDRVIRDRFADAASSERAEVRHAVRSAGADHVALSTSGDWLRTLAGFLSSRGARR